MSPQEILHFWFHELDAKLRFAKSAELDRKIRDRFLLTHREVIQGKTVDWRQTPEGRLAEIIVLDQFSRNMFRDSQEAFASDALALKLAQEAVAVGADQMLPLRKGPLSTCRTCTVKTRKSTPKPSDFFPSRGLSTI